MIVTIWLGLPFPIAGGGIALGLIGRRGSHRTRAMVAVVLGAAVVLLGTVGFGVEAIAQDVVGEGRRALETRVDRAQNPSDVVGSGEAKSSIGAGRAVTSPAAARIAWSVVALALCLTAAGRLVSARGGDGFLGRDLLYDLPWLAILATMAVVGALVASRQPHNPIGWILVRAVRSSAVSSALAEGYFERYSADGNGSRGWAETGAWLSNWAWIPLVVVPVVSLPLFFPHGRLLSRRWRVVPWAAGAGHRCRSPPRRPSRPARCTTTRRSSTPTASTTSQSTSSVSDRS